MHVASNVHTFFRFLYLNRTPMGCRAEFPGDLLDLTMLKAQNQQKYVEPVKI
jgi:hypothetical protein